MNEREIAEIRRRIGPQKNNIGRIRGCYVNEKHELLSEFNFAFGLISDNESEELLSLLRKTLSGSIGRNLIDIEFSNQQVLTSDEHNLLTKMRDSSLSDDDAVKDFYNKAISSIELNGSYIILLINDKYDVFSYGQDGQKQDSSELFSYLICAICPIKSSKPSLGYNIAEKKFKNIIKDSVISSPELGFMFPTFDNRCSNIYNALFYTRDIGCSHTDFTSSIFGNTISMNASEQTEGIASIISETLKDDCDIELVRSVQSQLIELSEDHKNNKEEEPLKLSVKDMHSLLRCSGVSEDSINGFNDKFEKDFGSNAEIHPSNIVNLKKFEVKTPEVSVKVDPEHSELVQTRIINGTKYILIRADGDIEVNGIKIIIND